MKRTKFLMLTILIPISGFTQNLLTLDMCKEMALEHNQKIKVATLNKDAAASLRKSAFTQFLPNFNVQGSYTYLNRDFQLLNEDLLFPVVSYTALGSDGKVDASQLANSIVINPATGQPVTDGSGNYVFQNYGWIPKDAISIDYNSIYLINAGFTQPVFTGGKIKETYNIAKYTEEAAKSNEKLTTSEVLYKVETYFWQVVTLNEKVGLANKYNEMLHALVGDLENYYSEGLITKNDLLKAKVKENEARLMVLKANNGLILSKMALFQQIGLPLDADYKISDSLFTAGNINKKSEINLSKSQRAELEMLGQQVNIAKSGVKLMKSRYLPNIGLSAGYLLSNPNPYNGFEKEFGGGFSVELLCNIPVFHWGDKHHTLNAAKAEFEASNLKYSEAQELITLEQKQASYKLSESFKTIETAESALEQADENLKVAQAEFEEGVVKATDIIEAQSLWQQAQTSVIEAKSEYLLNQTLVKKVNGQLNN